MIPEYEVNFGRARVKQPNAPWRGVLADRKVRAKTGSTIVANDMAGPKRDRAAEVPYAVAIAAGTFFFIWQAQLINSLWASGL